MTRSSGATARLFIHTAYLVDRIALVTCCVAAAAMTSLVLLQVLLRYVFNAPLIWVEEATILMMIWTTFIGASVGIRRGSHVAATSFIEMLPPRGLAAFKMGGIVLMLAFAVTTGWYGMQLAATVVGQSTIALGVSRALTYGMIPVGSALVALQCVAVLLGARHQDASNEMAV